MRADQWSTSISATFNEMLDTYDFLDTVADYVERLTEVIAAHDGRSYSDAAGLIRVTAEICERLGDTEENLRAKQEAVS
jgi:hypothetical protein